MTYRHSLDSGVVFGIASLCISLLNYFGITPKMISALPWKQIGRGFVKGTKFLGLLVAVGFIISLILSFGGTIFEYGNLLLDSIHSEMKIVIFLVGAFGFVTLVGYVVSYMGKFLIRHNPLKNIIEGFN